MEPTDEQHGKTAHLARQARDGDRAALEGLYERLAPALYAWVHLRIGTIRLDPQDVLQEVWLRAVRGAQAYNADYDFRSWIFGIAKNVLLQSIRNAAREPVVLPDGDELDLPDSVTSISSRLAQDEAVHRFLEYVRALPPDDYQIVLYCGLEGYTARAAGVRVGILPDTAAKRWQALRARLSAIGGLRALVD